MIANNLFMLFCKILYPLFLAEAADQNTAATFDHDAVLHALEHYARSIRSMHDASLAAIQMHILPDHGIAVLVMRQKSPQRAPCTYIAPSEVAGIV